MQRFYKEYFESGKVKIMCHSTCTKIVPEYYLILKFKALESGIQIKPILNKSKKSHAMGTHKPILNLIFSKESMPKIPLKIIRFCCL